VGISVTRPNWSLKVMLSKRALISHIFFTSCKNDLSHSVGLVVFQDMELEYLYVKRTFLHGDLDEELYMKQVVKMTFLKVVLA